MLVGLSLLTPSEPMGGDEVGARRLPQVLGPRRTRHATDGRVFCNVWCAAVCVSSDFIFGACLKVRSVPSEGTLYHPPGVWGEGPRPST